mgnify:CR=1 FL=1
MSAPEYTNVQLLIDGVWCDAASGATRPVLNPGYGSEVGRVAHAATADLDRALAAAERGLAAWRNVAPLERAKVLTLPIEARFDDEPALDALLAPIVARMG